MPQYDLDDIKKAAINSKIEYRGTQLNRRVQAEAQSLGFKFNDVRLTILELTEDCFDKTHHYEKGAPDDSYIITTDCRLNEGDKVTIYLKLRLKGKHLSIVSVGSFHLPRY
ncbi:type II toxin-antitoxin system MqsR family toxin [Kangiella sp.]|uniref:type II toxin-antitoxin system MqsR family toxin n=1 Tax=Kangiella sp. TaxID=1920245 RepID=UPI003A8E6356